MKLQKTIKAECSIAGKGLFSGRDVRLLFKPAPVETGIVFVRTDLTEPVRIEVAAKNIGQIPRRTTLQKGNVTIETTEHCMAAVSALGIDNLIIETDSAELPAAGGSSIKFFKLLKRAEVVEQQGKKKEFVITEPISITEGGMSIYALPYDDDVLNVTYDLDYGGHTGIGRQMYSCRLTADGFEKNLARARTFLLEAEAKQFQARGIGTHLGPRDILVINSDGPIKNKYLFENECVKHKILDLVGDLTLVGRAIKGRIVAYKSGHVLNQKLAVKLSQMAAKQDRLANSGTDAILDIKRIQKILPHRYPLLLVDRVIDVQGDRKITGIKNVTFNELFFQGHFPTTPVMPGVLIVEAMAQVSGLLFAQKLEHTGKLAVLLRMDDVKFRKAVVPGDQLILTSEVLKQRSRTAICKCTAAVNDTIVTEAKISFMLVEDEKI